VASTWFRSSIAEAQDHVRGGVQVLVVLGDRRVLHHLELVGLLVLLHGDLQAPCQVVVVPPGLDHQHAAARRQAGVGRGAVPVPQLLARLGRVGLLGVLDRVVDDEDVRALAGDAAADARSDVAAAVAVHAPLFHRLVVRVQAGGEHRLVCRVLQDTFDLAAEGHGQAHVVRAGDDFVVRVAPQVPGREHAAGQLALAVPRGHQQHQARAQALGHVVAEALQAPGDVLVHPARVIARVQPLGERDQAALAQHARGQLRLQRRQVGRRGGGLARR
jgi:hypothetical protein